jgi:uncharacterized protein YrrD
VVDPQSSRVAALCVDDRVVHWADITGLGPFAVMVRSRWAAGPAEGRTAELLASGHQVLGKPVLTAAGDEIGRVADVEFDPATGEILRLITPDGSIEGGDLLAAGSYAAVVLAR